MLSHLLLVPALLAESEDRKVKHRRRKTEQNVHQNADLWCWPGWLFPLFWRAAAGGDIAWDPTPSQLVADVSALSGLVAGVACSDVYCVLMESIREKGLCVQAAVGVDYIHATAGPRIYASEKQ